MVYEAQEEKDGATGWRVEAIDYAGDGDCYVTFFSGPDAETRAREYAAWKNAQA